MFIHCSPLRTEIIAQRKPHRGGGRAFMARTITRGHLLERADCLWRSRSSSTVEQIICSKTAQFYKKQRGLRLKQNLRPSWEKSVDKYLPIRWCFRAF